MTHYPEAGRLLAEFQPRAGFFVGIDSDGCAFDSMELTYKECLCPNTIRYWGLHGVSRFAREAILFVNLYSKWRGTNRWPALVMALDLLRERPEVLARRVRVTEAAKVREFIDSGFELSNNGLQAYMADHPHPELEAAMTWSTGVNASIADMAQSALPFPFVRESLELAKGQADMVAISEVPGEVLARAWEEHGLARYVRLSAGLELGSKKQQLALATKDRYAPSHVLMVGDAPDDLEAAQANHALFFPILAGQEDASWERLYREGFARFVAGTYRGPFEAELLAEFERLLPSTPPWQATQARPSQDHRYT